MIPLALITLSLAAGALLLHAAYRQQKRPALASRLAHADGAATASATSAPVGLPAPVEQLCQRYERELRRAGGTKTLARLLTEKVLLALAAPLVPLLPYLAATGHMPSLAVVFLIALAGFFIPDLLLRTELKRRSEAIFLDLPETISVLALALRAGQSLRQALELAARDNPGPLGQELQRALSLARTSRGLGEREALVRVASEAGEPTFVRFAELLAVKESPYLDFLQQQAREARAEQGRYLERAADRAYLAMHAPLAPLLAIIVLLFAYGFLRFLAHTA